MKISGFILSLFSAAIALTGCGGFPLAPGIEHQVHPDTDQAPALALKWENTALFDAYEINVGTFGVWEGEPANEIEMHIMLLEEPVPIYAYAPGTVTNAGDGEVTVRYGTRHAVHYYHITDTTDAVSVGSTVETGELLGYTETLDGGQFWELAVSRVTSDRRRAFMVPPVEYMDSASLQFLNGIAANYGGQWTAEPDSTAGTSEETRGDSWFDEVGVKRYPDDMSRLGFAFAPNYEADVISWIEEREAATGHDLQWLIDYVQSHWR